MNLGGFVIHDGKSADRLGATLDSLAAVCDDVVAVASTREEAVEAAIRRRGVRPIFHRWEGYGSARAAAARALSVCDFLFFLDSDEWLEPDAVRAIRAWKSAPGDSPYHALRRRDHADLVGGRFVYRTEHHVRLVRADAARWTPSMIVHEALPPDRTTRLDATIEHLFATDVGAMDRKCERYALLWALRFSESPRRVKSPGLQRAFHVARELILRGALLRGGLRAIPLANAVARHHSRKYELLAQIRSGAHAELTASFARGDYSELFAALPDALAARRVEPAVAGVKVATHAALPPRGAGAS